MRTLRRLVSLAGGLCLLVAVVLAGMIFFGTVPAPPPLASVYDAVKAMDFTDAPPVHLFRARDGADLTFRTYAGSGDNVVVLVHGSTGSSLGVHPLAKALNAGGFTIYAPDIRGHGASRRRGDIDYIGQLDDDIADLVAVINREHPGARLALVGFSAGGGLTLRVAGGPYGALFERYILLAPYLGHEAPTNQAGNGGWAVAYIPRIIAITILNRAGIHWFDGLPVIAYARWPDPNAPLPTYSFRLTANFRPSSDYRADLRNATRPITVLVGAADDEMIATAYAPAIHAVRPSATVAVLPGLGHIDMTTAPAAIEAITTALK
jgi:non-heme chloroperoxidase